MLEQVKITELPTQEQARYFVHLSTFDGPLDLLLHLIEKCQMEITTISLVEVTDQYLEYLRQWEAESLPLANMAAFVATAAHLLLIKSQSLLPQSSKEQGENELESTVTLAEELQRHLVEYKLTKEIAQILRKREEEGLQTYGRSGLLAGIEAQLTWTPPILASMEVRTLARSFQRLLELQNRDAENGSELVPTARVRVSERIAEIKSQLHVQPSVLLSSLLLSERSRLVIIVTFIAVLELWKWERINVRQDELMGPITLERGAHWSEEWQEVIEDTF
ncbi:MAG: segregation/condensation protein A [Ktedonobacteraceae bacterium]|nr:segregation/condensation protein A [Ktedonobacteraceae bacterium]